MADSDNTTALPFVTQGGRRKSCAVDDDGAVGDSVHPVRLRAPLDPCVVLLQEWEQAHHMAVVLCRLQQRLEIRIRNALASSLARGESENDQHSTPQASVLIDRQARWDELDREVGYSRARAAEAQAVEAEDDILDAVATTPAQSLAGVIAKLKIIVGGGENMGDTSAFPWPQIQSVLADLKALGEGGLDLETNGLRPSVSNSTTVTKSHPRRS
ncbi:hypothetical protein [Aminobacter ciceronei]|uniref:Uncharacterized protein n=1 Tax=Aminobacter ciceronei TaxID=150723 RepID=A0ABR6C4B2_9HYPH|nr:hypothetical protein [Aminobacter ciceronei]MBA8906050.1 hypothetical protein [Aminobacter ciceronei]MBA9019829.1 hypothetical protein [Aminobacter ciceronei]